MVDDQIVLPQFYVTNNFKEDKNNSSGYSRMLTSTAHPGVFSGLTKSPVRVTDMNREEFEKSTKFNALGDVDKISLSQLVKSIENINVEDIPLNERNHTLISKVYNKFNSLKKSHFKNAENKGIVEKIGTNEFRNVSYQYEVKKIVSLLKTK